jgi:hypothetical protein
MATPTPAPAASQALLFADLGPRKVLVDFSGGSLSSDGGALFLRQLDTSLGLTRTLAGCFGDQRDPRLSITRCRNCCASGSTENVLKQQTLDLEADKLSTHCLASNQLRLGLACFAYLLIERLRALGCHGMELARGKLLEPTLEQGPRGRAVTWSHPAFAYRRVFARSDRELDCANLSAERKTD